MGKHWKTHLKLYWWVNSWKAMYVEDFWELGRVAAGLNPVPSVIRHRYHFKPGSKGCAFHIFTGEFRTVAHGTLARLLATFWGRWTRRRGIARQRSALQWSPDSIQYSKSWSSQSSGQQQQALVNRWQRRCLHRVRRALAIFLSVNGRTLHSVRDGLCWPSTEGQLTPSEILST